MRAFDRLPETERDLWITRWEKARERCPDCGNPIAECSDPRRQWWSYRRVDYAAMERMAAEAAYEALHEKRPWHNGTFTSWADKRSASHPYHFKHGVTIGVADHDVTPWDSKWTTQESASPVPPSSPGSGLDNLGDDPQDGERR